MDMFCRKIPHRVDVIFLQQEPVELHLDLRMADAADLDHLLHIRMAFTVQGKVADHSVDIGSGSRRVLRLCDNLCSVVEKHIRHLVMKRISLAVHRIL